MAKVPRVVDGVEGGFSVPPLPEGLMPTERALIPAGWLRKVSTTRQPRPETKGIGQAEDVHSVPGSSRPPVMIDTSILEQLLQAHFDRLERVLVDQVSSLRGHTSRNPDATEISAHEGPAASSTRWLRGVERAHTVAMAPNSSAVLNVVEETGSRRSWSGLLGKAHSMVTAFFQNVEASQDGPQMGIHSSVSVADSDVAEDTRRKSAAYTVAMRRTMGRTQSTVVAPPTPPTRSCVPRPGHGGFETFFAAAILLNAISLGVEVQFMARTGEGATPATFHYVQLFFGLVFAIELGMRLSAFCTGLHKSERWWLFFDTVIIVSSVLHSSLAVLVPSPSGGMQGLNGFSSLRALRVFRAARMLRAFRIRGIIRYVLPLQVLIYSIGTTLRSLVWALVLLFMIIYGYSIILTQAVIDHTADGDLSSCTIERNLPLCTFFGDLVASIFTMFKCIAGGISWHEVTEALAPMGSRWPGLFSSYILFTYFGVLNVVTGVYCNSAIEAAQRNPALVVQNLLAQKEKYVGNIKSLFSQLHDPTSKSINVLEFEMLLSKEEMKAYFAAVDIDADEAWGLFKMLDTDETGEIDIEDFVDGCLRVKGNARAIELEKVRVMMQRQAKKLSNLVHRLEVVRPTTMDATSLPRQRRTLHGSSSLMY